MERFGLTNSWQSCALWQQLSASMVVAEPTVSGAVSSDLVCWQNVDIFNTKCADCDVKSRDLEGLKC